MIVVCIDTSNIASDSRLDLTIGKEYHVYLENSVGYYVTDDCGLTQWYSKRRFSAAEWRDKQIDKVLNGN